jgi:outer membrane scaffolding protein for murein synthesis (MipA/OmpV family)
MSLRTAPPALPASALALTLTLFGATAQAQDIDSIRQMPAAEGQGGGIVGLGVASGPRFPGADDTRTRVLPVLGYQWANGWFASTIQGVGVNLSSTPGLQYGPRLTVDFGRKADSDSRLRGMGDVKAAAELGGFVNYRVADALSLNANLRAGSGEDHKGVRMDLGAAYGFQLPAGVRLRLGASTTLANQAYAQTHFGVTSGQSVSSGYALYTPKAGFQDVRASIGLNVPLAPRVMLSTALTSTTLLGDAKSSPLVSKTSSVSGQIGVAYGF